MRGVTIQAIPGENADESRTNQCFDDERQVRASFLKGSDLAVADLRNALVEAHGDQLLEAWLRENASKLHLPHLTSAPEPGNTPAPIVGNDEKKM